MATTTLPDIIPPSDPARCRTLVLCFDGTGDQFDADNSNVIQLFTLLQKDDHTQQMVYYQAGIGTYTVPQIATPFMANLSKNVDAAIAWNLDAHVMDGYTFLMQNYQAGDKICIFGFSRGAYTARSLAGMVHKVGLLPSCNHQQVPFAYKMFTRTDETGWRQSVAFKKAFSVDVDIEFVGVWDTVCSVGLIPRRLPFVSSNTAIRYFRHAVSLDERRAKFKANLYNRPTDEESKLGTQPGDMPVTNTSITATATITTTDTYSTSASSTAAAANTLHKGSRIPGLTTLDEWVGKGKDGKTGSVKTKKTTLDVDIEVEEEEFDAEEGDRDRKKETDVLEVWFAGCHCDVGGGSVPNNTPHNLARIPLRWMIRQCFLAKTGIRFHTSLFPNVGLDPATLYPDVKPRPQEVYATAELVEDLQNAEAATYLMPTSFSVTKATAEVESPTPTANRVSSPPMHDRTDSGLTLVDGDVPASHTLTKTTTLRETALLTTSAGAFLTEEHQDLLDSLCPIYDELSLAKVWWILEIIPQLQRYQRPDDTWDEKYECNMGHGREIPRRKARVEADGVVEREKVYVHRSVKVRESAEGMVQMVGRCGEVLAKKGSYKPRATIPEDAEVIYVE
ncbi:hypothetical protein PHLCEN_2v11085 [Hermanssonia centrifuga]|uniref:T6SS Phospholipase effector Tle1-like catalytic domain-containing protein n=1 Tax=Hermanssonia centrifuga TaxID=98765 RepID=A0A2R6NL34_9APHY|nr:hypothetical protein PHLCEN_2v11085 [Hermanssonia centrifuga]